MRALWIATSLCLASTVVLAQSASKTVVSLDTCFKLVRVTEANCSTSANDAAQRQECLQNARKVQLVCLELAGPQASASVDRPPAAADAVSPDKPAEAVSRRSLPPAAIPPVNPVARRPRQTRARASRPRHRRRLLRKNLSQRHRRAWRPASTSAPSSRARLGLDGERNVLARGLFPSRHGDDPRAVRDAGMRQRRWWFVAADAAPNSGCAWRASRARRVAAKSSSPTRSTISRWSSCAGLHPRMGRRRITGRTRPRCCSRFPRTRV